MGVAHPDGLVVIYRCGHDAALQAAPWPSQPSEVPCARGEGGGQAGRPHQAAIGQEAGLVPGSRCAARLEGALARQLSRGLRGCGGRSASEGEGARAGHEGQSCVTAAGSQGGAVATPVNDLRPRYASPAACATLIALLQGRGSTVAWCGVCCCTPAPLQGPLSPQCPPRRCQPGHPLLQGPLRGQQAWSGQETQQGL
jgi:hypothetical protein